MENRLPWHKRIPLLLLMGGFFSFSTVLSAQNFTLNYTGPDTLYVGNDCTTILDWGHPNTVSFTEVNGHTIDTFFIDNINAGFAIGDQIRAPRNIFVSYFVQDTTGANEILQAVLKIVIADTTKPVFDLATLPNDTTYQTLNEVPNPPSISTIAATDNCGIETIRSEGETNRPDKCGSFMRKWAAIDTAGNRTVYEQTITIEGTGEAPVWTGTPTNLNLFCSSSVSVQERIDLWLASNGNATVSDTTGIVFSHDYTQLINGCGITGNATVTFTATDECGASSTVNGIINVEDNIRPSIDVAAMDVSTDAANPSITLQAWLAAHGNAMASDFCATIDNSDTSANWSIIRIDTMAECNGNATYTATFLVTDDCSNADSTTATYTIIDTSGISIAGLIPDTSDACGGDNDLVKLNQWFIRISEASFFDNGGNELDFVTINYTSRDSVTGTWSGSGIPLPMDLVPSNDCLWYIDAVISFEDVCNEIVRDTARFSITDTIPPVLSGVPTDTTVSCGQIPTADISVAMATDNCDQSPTITIAESYDTTLSTILITRNWIATDDCGNTDSIAQLITVVDTIAPVLQAIPEDTLVACGSIPDSILVLPATDNCTDSTDIIIRFIETSNQFTHPDSCQTYNYTITRQWVATDAFSNSDTATQIITVVDTVAPTFTVPADTLISCELRDDLMITGTPTNLSDNCDTLPEFSFVDLVIGGDCVGGGALDTIVRTWTVEDACGNSSEAVQRIILIDTTPPVISGLISDITVQCDGDEIPLPMIGTDISATDNCTNSPIIQYIGETSTKGNSPDSCNYYNFMIARTWRATDGCGNSNDLVQNITIVDTIAPTIVCPLDLVVSTDSTNCMGNVVLPLPFYFDNCTGANGRDSLTLTQSFTNGPGDDVNVIPVDTLVFNFNIGAATPTKIISSDLVLTINLNSVDGEGTNEIFSIIGEDGTVFGGTTPSLTQCGNSTTTITIPATIANEYARDSMLTFLLGANGSGMDAINNVCTGGNANLTIQYDFEEPSSSINLAYKIDEGAVTPFINNGMENLPVGDHSVTYYATDCSGNADSCVFELTVIDQIAPTFDCPENITAYTDTSGCEAMVTLPFPTNLTDNCDMLDGYAMTIADFLVFNTDVNGVSIPVSITDTFLINMPNAIGDGTLKVSFLGDNKDAGEFFNIYGENGMLLGTTALSDSTSECSVIVDVTFNLAQDTINAWAADGNIIIQAIPNSDTLNFSDVINPCASLNANGTDANSVLSIALNFPTTIINYSIADSNDVPITSGRLRSPVVPVSETFGAGVSRITYTIEDGAGNVAACLFTVEVKDTIAPTVTCSNDFVVRANPSGSILDLSALADSLVISTSDNCGVASISIVNDTISCLNIGMENVTVIVADSSGNTVTCQAIIEIIEETLEPTFSVGVCNNDALFLFADTTFQLSTDPNANLSYNWTGPNNFTSTDANPTIANVGTDNSGIYTLTITGSTGCTATGEIFVNINNIDVPLINTPSNSVCTSDGITLTTSAANCTNLAYQWFEIIERVAPLEDTIMLVGTSVVPSFSIAEPTAGQHKYYLVVQCDDCTSLGSEILTITAFDVPLAVTGEEVISICEGADIVLSSPLTDQSFTYNWVGPGFTADLPTPAPIPNATAANEGIYTLTVSKDGCTSEEAFTVVNITDRPAKPGLANDSGPVICEGSPMVLRTDATNANTYIWTNTSTLATFTTTTPELSIDTATVTDAGMWIVTVESANCPSESSDGVMVQVEAKPNGIPFFTGAACEGRMIDLNVNPIIAGASYEWQDVDGTAFFGADPMVPVQAQYTLIITSVNGCETVQTLPVEVKETPVITTLFDSGDANPCIIPDDTNIQIVADVFPANDGTYTYTWTTPDGTVMAPIPDSMLMIPNASSSAVNGTYTLVVNTGDGCMSDPASNIVEVADIPVPNPVITANSTELCEGESLILSATEYPNISAQYRWLITSIMDTLTQSPVLVLDSVTTALNGVVTLQVLNGDCPSAATATLAISINTPLAQPAVSAPNAFCEGDVISLTTSNVPNATYLWDGPNFSASSSTPDIVVTANASLENNGGYRVQILSNGCTSPTSEPLVIGVNEVPFAPLAGNSGDICIDNTSDIILFIDQENTPLGAEFSWYNADNNQLIAGPNTFKSQIIEVGNLEAGTYRFYATQTLNGCESIPSSITELTLASIPSELAQTCSGNMVICDVNQAMICAQEPQEGTGTWATEDTTITIEFPNEPETMVRGLEPGESYTFFWTLSNGICGEYSATRLIVDVGVAGSIAQVCNPLMEVCEGTMVNLCANPVPSGFTAQWSQPSSQAALGVTINNRNASNTTVSTIEPGNPSNAYTFYWSVSDDEGVCTAVDTMRVNVYGIPDAIAAIDDEELIACNEDAVVAANALPNGLTGVWTSNNEAVVFVNPNNPSTLIENLSPGMNTLTWSLISGACTNFSSDEITVFYEQAPQANDDVFDIGFSSSAMLNVMDNDEIFSPEYDISVISNPMNGTLEMDMEGNINYVANENFVGSDFFTYELCNPTCASDCSTAQVELKIGEDASCIIPTIMTPNGDNVNDVFMIPCLETDKFPRNEVIIFNQWGDEIFRAAPYNNDWRGTYNGEDIPAGTYYYVIAFDRNSEPSAGFLIVER